MRQEQLGQVVWWWFLIRLQSDGGLAGVIFKAGHSHIWHQSWEHEKSWQLKHWEQSTSNLMLELSQVSKARCSGELDVL